VLRILFALAGFVLGEWAWQWALWFTHRYERDGVPIAKWTLSGVLHVITVLLVGGISTYGSFTGGDRISLIVILVSSMLLVTIALVDLRVRRIPNVMVAVLVGWGLVRSLVTGQPSLWGWGLGLLVGGGVFLVITLVGRGAMGPGDVKLAAALGALVGYPAVWGVLWVGILAGGVVTLVLLLARRVGRKDYMAYGPYLAFGGWVILWVQCGGNL